MSKEEQYELFESFLDQSMTDEEENSFEQLLLNQEFNNEFEEFKSIRSMYNHILVRQKEEDNFLGNLKNIAAQYPASALGENRTDSLDKKTSSLQITKAFVWIGAIAAVFILGFFIYPLVFAPKQTTQQLFASYYSPEKINVERGNVEDSLTHIAGLYAEKKYQQVEPKLTAYSNQHPENTNIKLVRAICALELQHYQQAEKELQDIMAMHNEYEEKAQWYLSLAYLKQNKKQEALNLLQQFGEHHFYFHQAKQIISVLK